MRRTRFVAAIAALALLVSTEQAAALLPQDLGLGWQLPDLQKEHSVPGSSIPFRPIPTPGNGIPSTSLAAPVWPAAADADVVLPDGPQDSKQANGIGMPAQAAGTPVKVAHAKATDAKARKANTAAPQVHVHVADHGTSDKLGLTGLVFTVADKANAAAEGPVRVTLDYKDFATAYGGGWGDRLRLVSLPACALSTPDKPACRTKTPVPTTNDAGAKTLSAEVPLAQGQILAADPDQKGSSGTFQAQPLSPAGSWSSGGSSGSFSYTYPFATPPGINGALPTVGMGYMSSAVDGLTSGTNNQASLVGDGWDFTPGGYVERHFQSCAEDIGGNNPAPGTGDNCLGVENATLVLGGKSSELIKLKDNIWIPKSDDGSKVELLSGAANNAWNGEYWKVTTIDGTQYFLGRNRLPGWTQGKAETQSVLTAPVFSNNPGEPCYHEKFADSHCDMAWRWGLDYAVDPNGNVISYYYQPEVNYYGLNLNRETAGTKYNSGGYPLRIEYGLHLDNDSVYGSDAVARVTFDVAERCVPSSTFDCAPDKLTAANAGKWPDVPFDQVCKQGDVCAFGSTSFFSRKRLTGVHTQIRTGGGIKFDDVDSWELKQSFPGSGDATPPAMWLDEIIHTGKGGDSRADITLPSTKFAGFIFANRVDTVADKYTPLTRRRLVGIENETGGYIGVAYSGDDSSGQYCKAGVRMPASPETDTMRCYAAWWSPPSSHEPVLDWFHKYLVTDITELDLTGGAAPVKVHYDYLGTPAWHYDEGQFTKQDKKTWGQWRGYETIRTTTGESSAPQLVTETLYLRGMDGDHLPDGSTRAAKVTDSTGGTIVDQDPLQGIPREVRNYKTVNGPVQSAQITHPWLFGPTATSPDGLVKAYKMDTDSVRGRTLMADGKTYRTSEVTKKFDEGRGLATQVEDLGDTAVSGDETCTKLFYFLDTFNQEGIRNRTRESYMYAGKCADAYTADNNITHVQVSYDGQPYNTPPTRGNITETDALDTWDSTGPHYVPTSRNGYDKYGREVSSEDVFDKFTTTKYLPETVAPVTGSTTTNTYGWTSTTTVDPNWGNPTAAVDQNGVRLDTDYDALGRKTAVWTNSRSKPNGDTPTAKFNYVEYDRAKSLPTSVESMAVQDNGSYVSSFSIYDGLGRLRQTQSTAAGGGRILSDQVYDSRGLVYKTNNGYFNDQSGPSKTLIQVADNQVFNQTVTEFDSRGRATASIFFKKGVEQWRTTTIYEGDRTTTIPPAGGSPESVVTNVQGQTTQQMQYTNGYTVGAANPADVMKYTYNAAGAMTSMTDSSGNTWKSGYDLRGRVVSQDDPDTGHSTYTYDKAGQVKSTTDGRGKSVFYTYDDLGRKTQVNADTATGTKLATWTYDTLTNGLGLLTSSTRWDGTDQYTTKITGYDDFSRPTGTRVDIPAKEGPLAGQYPFSVTYSPTGAVASTTSPAKGGLLAEHVQHTYDGFGLPSTSYIIDDTTGTITNLVSQTDYTSFKEVARLQFDAATAATDVWLTQTYDEATRRPQTTAVDRATQVNHQLADRTYEYDPAGQVTKIADTPEVGGTDVQCFGYDYLQRMSEAWTPTTQDCSKDKSASALGGAAPYWQSFTFDKTGNRRTMTSHTTAGDVKSTYSYPTDGKQPHTLRSVDTAGPTGTSTSSYGYDDGGNMITRNVGGNPQTFTYDTAGHSATAKDSSGDSTYTYDADGKRIITHAPTSTTLFVGDMELVLNKSTNVVTGTRFYSHGGGGVAERTGSGGLTWMLADQHGTGSLSITAGSMKSTQRYTDPFGNPRGAQVTWPDKHGFVGGYQDATGLTHLGARDYDPSTGRFTQADPVLDPSSPQLLNGYAYANNAPATMSDPGGTEPHGGPCMPSAVGWMRSDGTSCSPGNDQPVGGSGPAPGGTGSAGQAARNQTLANNNFDEQADRWAHDTKKKSGWDVFIDIAGEVIKSLISWDDITGCIGHGEIGSCVSLIVTNIPWGKIFKAPEIIGAFWRGAKALINFGEDVARAEKILAKDAKILKEADEAAKAATTAAADAERVAADEARAAQAAKEAGTAESSAGRSAEHGGGEKSEGVTACPTGHSFVAGTQVLLADGSHKAIQDVQVGDVVMATDPDTGQTTPQEVTATWVHDNEEARTEVTLDTDTGNQTLNATDWHPVWVADLQTWLPIGSIPAGSWLRTSSGSWVQVTAVRHYSGTGHVYDLTVNSVHAYYVLAGTAPILVHNCNGGGTTSIYRTSPKARGTSERDRGLNAKHFPRTADGSADGAAHFGNEKTATEWAQSSVDTHGTGFRTEVPTKWLQDHVDAGRILAYEGMTEEHMEYIIPKELFGDLNEFPRFPWSGR
jgi:RHS repeat-associated protein